MAKSVELASRNTRSTNPSAPAAYINKDTIQVVTGPGKMERYVIPVGANLMTLGPLGIITYLASSVLVHAPPIWPYFVFFGVLLLGAALYFTAQKRPEYGEQSRVVKGRTIRSRKIK
jgi:hypothetical protein